MSVDALAITVRWLHLVAMATLVGAIIIARLGGIHGDSLRRVKPLLHAAMGVILLTGFVNYVRGMSVERPSSYHMLVGMKIVLALIVFSLVSVALKRKTGEAWPGRRAGLLFSLAVFFSLLVMLIAGIARTMV